MNLSFLLEGMKGAVKHVSTLFVLVHGTRLVRRVIYWGGGMGNGKGLCGYY